MAFRLLFEPLDIVQLATPAVDQIDIDRTAIKIRQFKANSTKKSYNPAIAHADGFASGAVSLPAALAGFDGVNPEWWGRHLKAVTERLHGTLANNGSVWRPLGRKPLEAFDGVWFKPAIRGAWRHGDRRDAALVNPRFGVSLPPLSLSFLARSVIEFHLRDEPNLTGLAILDYGRHESKGRRTNRVLYEEHIAIMNEVAFVEALKRFVIAARLAGADLQPREAERIRDLFRMPRFKWD